MNTVMTPDAVQRSYKQCTLRESGDPNFTGDEVFLFIYPSTDPINEDNGDGELWEIQDWSADFGKVWTDKGEHTTTPDTIVWWR